MPPAHGADVHTAAAVPALERMRLGRGGPDVVRIAFGCEPLGGTDWGAVDEGEIERAVAEAVELGIDVFDTADVYGLGRSEERLARALGPRRHDVVIATKGGVAWRARPGSRAETYLDGSARHMRTAVEASLRRLRVDSIPLYQVHWPDPSRPVEEAMEALARCREEGTIQHIGCSNFDEAQVRAASAIVPLLTTQVSYSLLDRRAEAAVLGTAAELGMGALAYGPLAQGLLTGKYDRDASFGDNDRRSRLPHFGHDAVEQGLRVVERLRRVASDRGVTPAQAAVRWVLDQPHLTCAIVGVKSRRQLAENVRALGWQLTPAEMQYLAGTTDHEEGGVQ